MSKLIKFETRAEFENFVKTNSGLDNLDEALTSENNGVYGKIALIVDTNEIYVKKQIFNTGTGGGESTAVEYALKSEVQELDETKQDIIFDLSTIREGAAKGATALQSVPEGYVTEDALAMVATTGNYSDLNDKPNVHIIDLTDDAASVHSQITEAYNTTNPIFYSRPPGIFGPDYYPCKVEDLGGYFNVYMSFVRSAGSITIFHYNVFSTEIVQKNAVEIAIPNNSGSDGYLHTLELSMIGDGTQVLANNGLYTTLKTINGDSILGSGDISTPQGVYVIELLKYENGSYVPGVSYSDIKAAWDSGIRNFVMCYYQGTHYYPAILSVGQDTIIAGCYAFNSNYPTGEIWTLTLTASGETGFDMQEAFTNKLNASDAAELYQPKNCIYNKVDHGTSDTTFALTPNTLHIWGEVSSLTLTLGSEIENTVNDYQFQFTSGTTATTLSLPDTIVWANGEALTPEASKTYQVSIVNSFAIYTAF